MRNEWALTTTTPHTSHPYPRRQPCATNGADHQPLPHTSHQPTLKEASHAQRMGLTPATPPTPAIALPKEEAMRTNGAEHQTRV